jgi:MoxR-like ATPase
MALPAIPELMRPVLEAHAGGQALSLELLADRLAPELGVSEEERRAQQPSGDLVFVQRLGWARNNLVQTGVLERADDQTTRITQRGREVAAAGGPIPMPPNDWARKRLSRESVHSAIAEFDRNGRDETLKRHGFRRALDYVVVHDGRKYDSKALYGIAYGIEHPDEEPIRTRGLQGGQPVIGRLEELGFEVRSEKGASPEGTRVWLIRAGRQGLYEELALDENVTLIGWSELGELSPEVSREELKEMIRNHWNEHREASLGSQAGQIYRFVHDVVAGDLVVLPLMSDPGHVAIGRVLGGYVYRTDGPFAGTDAQNTRQIEWLGQRLSYGRFDPDLREAFGQQGTVSEITKPSAAERLLQVVGGADASAIHLVLKWPATLRPDTIERHKEVADTQGAVWWGRHSKPGVTGLSQEWLEKLRGQLQAESETYVFLHKSSASTWRTRLLEVTTERSDVEAELVPEYYNPETFHSLWVKVADFEQVEPSELTDRYVLAQSGDPVTQGGLGNQGPLIVRRQSGTLPGRYFILNQARGTQPYNDAEGERYHWTSNSSGAWKQLANSPGARFIYYRPGQADDGTSKTYFGAGRIASVVGGESNGLPDFTASIEDFQPFAEPVPWQDGPTRNAQTSIQPITRVQYDKLIAAGGGTEPTTAFDVDSVRKAAEARGLNLAPEIYAHVVAALSSGKHVILTGPPGTAKTTLAQALAESAQHAGLCDGYLLTTATADWTTYETIGGLRPTGPDTLEFEEGHFLRAIEHRQWLVIDELNRSHFDRAFGQLFTVLSGQPVVLPYHRADASPDEPLVLLPEGAENPVPNGDVLEIPQQWRVIATMNVFDKSLLFEMSFALMRRFAFIEVASPSETVFQALIDRETAGDSRAATLAKELLSLRAIKDLGPAVFMDLARFLRERITISEAEDGQLLFESFYSYLLPQFEGIDAATGELLFSKLATLVGAPRKERLRATLNGVLGLELEPPHHAAPDLEPSEPEIVEQPEV